MVHAKELPVRMQILQLIEEGHPSCRRLFVDYHGLPIIWSWMVDCTSDQEELKIQVGQKVLRMYTKKILYLKLTLNFKYFIIFVVIKNFDGSSNNK